MALQPWYKVAMPREDLRKGQPLDASEFAIHLDQVVEGRAPRDYREPERFFARTFITKGLETLSVEVLRRLAGEGIGSSPGVNLTTQFGGGKTHALVLLYYLAKHGEASHAWHGVPDLLKKAGLPKVPKARVAAFVGNRFDFVRGSGKDGEPRRKTPWGDVAWQLGGSEAYGQIEEHDREGIVPGGEVLEGILSGEPVLILMDEVLNYVRRTRDAGGDYARVGSQMYSFLDVLTREAVGRSGLVLCVSLPMSEYEMTQDDLAEYQRLSKLMNRLSQPAMLSEGLEIAEIIRRRLFEEFDDEKEIRRTVRDYARWVVEHREQLPAWFPVDTATQVFKAAYPFHPVVLSVFERKWQALPQFQRTRGVLRMLALWVSRLYQESFMAGHRDPLIGLGSAPLGDSHFRAAIFEQLGEQRLEAAVLADIAGAESWAVRLDTGAPDTIRRARLHQKAATAIFFESSGGQVREEATLPEVRLAVGEPGLDIGNVETVLEDMVRSCYFLSAEGTRYRFSHTPNLNKLLADRRATVSEPRVEERVREAIRKVFDAGPKTFERRYFPTDSGIPDTPVLALVVMPPDQTWESTMREETKRQITTYIQECGARSRTYKSALLFAMASTGRQLTDDAKNLLALESLEGEIAQLSLDEVEQRRFSKQLAELKGRSERDLKEHIWQAYRYVGLLDEGGAIKEVDLGPLHSSAGESLVGLIQARLKQEGLLEESINPDFLVRNWPPALPEWSTKGVRDAFYASPQLPRLTDSQVLRKTIAEGVRRGKFGYASKSPDGSYQTVAVEEATFGEGDVEFSEQVVLLPKETAVALKEGRPPVDVGAGGEEEAGREVPEGGEGKERGGGVSVAPPGERVSSVSWRGEVPARQWMQFYTKVLSRFATQERLRLEVNFQVSPPEGISKDKVEETKASLRELGLDAEVSVGEPLIE